MALPGVETLLRHIDLPKSTLTDIPSSGMRGSEMVCFSCDRSGHGVSRCSRIDTTFPFLSPRWSVDFRDGQSGYVAHGSAGKHRLVWAGGSASKISKISSSTDPGGGGSNQIKSNFIRQQTYMYNHTYIYRLYVSNKCIICTYNIAVAWCCLA